ncbi:MAG TPA: tail fiber domain-containing protein, partial [Candidatus Paceibacterota bacterium]|nr:tail fiber domain-containing protein [Candidatus Paceibacterota bacterium]
MNFILRKLKIRKIFQKALVFLSVFLFCSLLVSAAPIYSPGETLDPDCGPDDPDCTVAPPALSGINTNITELSALTDATTTNLVVSSILRLPFLEGTILGVDQNGKVIATTTLIADPSWGAIGGALSAQTDLVAALAGKIDVGTTSVASILLLPNLTMTKSQISDFGSPLYSYTETDPLYAAASSTILRASYSSLSSLLDDSTHRLVTDVEKGLWNGKQDALGFVPVDSATTSMAALTSVGGLLTISGGNVGIGTTSPLYSLSVEGSSSLGNQALAGYFTATSTTAASTFAGGLTVNSNSLVVDYSTGNVGIGTAAPLSTLSVTGTPGTSPFTVASSTGSTMFTMLENGNVGIGTSNPQYTIDIAGTINAIAIRTPYEHTITVAKAGGDYTTITEALNAITDNDATHLYHIKVMPGVYEESITMKPYVDISGSGENSTIISGTGGTVVTAAANSLLEKVKITRSAAGEVYGVSGSNVDNFILRDANINVTSTNNIVIGVCVDNGSANVVIDNVQMTVVGQGNTAGAYGIYSENTSIVYVYNSQMTVTQTGNQQASGIFSYETNNKVYFYNSGVTVNQTGTGPSLAMHVDSGYADLQFVFSNLTVTATNNYAYGFYFGQYDSNDSTGLIVGSKVSVTGSHSTNQVMGLIDWGDSGHANVTIRDSIITATNLTGNSTGIGNAFGSATKIFDSEITGVGTGAGKFGRAIKATSGTGPLYVQNSKLTGTGNSSASGQGVYVPNGGNVTLLNNQISGSTKDIVIDAGGTVNSSFNTYTSLTNAGTLRNVSSDLTTGNFLVSGKIGIGTTSPWAQLSVNPNGISGPAFAIGSSTLTNFLVDNGGNTTINVDSGSVQNPFTYKRGDTTNFKIDYLGGLYTAAIRTMSAGNSLSLGYTGNNNVGNINLVQIGNGMTRANTSGNQAALAIIPTYNQTSGTAANTDLLINRTETALGSGLQYLIDAQVGGVSKFNVTNTGNVGIGTSTPDYTFQVYIDASNEGHVASTGDWARSSDSSLKKNILTLEGALDKVMQLRGVRYDWLADEEATGSAHIGFIAQEVEAIFPEFVDAGASGIKGVSYGAFTPVLLQAIKEQQGIILFMTSASTTGLIFASSTNAIEDRMTEITSELSDNFINYFEEKISNSFKLVKEFVAERVSAMVGYFGFVKAGKVHSLEGYETVDKATGDTYCIYIKNGEVHSALGA